MTYAPPGANDGGDRFCTARITRTEQGGARFPTRPMRSHTPATTVQH